ncbi:P3 protein [Aspergillus lentulus jivivirus 1]|nr:P3 protein [Aspergillus lentulus jivivirus 1]
MAYQSSHSVASGGDVGRDTNVLSQQIQAQASHLAQYHKYLEQHYASGVDRFFSPTGFLDKFQRTVSVVAEKKRDAVYVRDMADATSRLRKVVEGGEGVYDLTAEPGTGKTSVLPFRFPDSKVVVALPTPFDAWSAFNTATGKSALKLKGLTLGNINANVVYMDSYMAANMVLSGFMDYDILMVDECDSGKGVTGFLADVKAPGKVLIRMSASHGKTNVATTSSFTVHEVTTLPDVRTHLDGFVQIVREQAKGRSLVLLPDPVTAAKVASLIPGSRLVSSKTNLGDMARFVLENIEEAVFVSDDACARGLNLNLNMLFDSQLVSEHGTVRVVNDNELYQRKGRVGRNKSGYYYSPGFEPSKPVTSVVDMFRSNVVRAVAGVPQDGPEVAHVSPEFAEELLFSSVEPYALVVQAQEEVKQVETACVNDQGADARFSPPGSPGSPVMYSTSGSGSPAEVSVAVPKWLAWGFKAAGKESAPTMVNVVASPTSSKKKYLMERRKSSTSSSGGERAMVSYSGGGSSPAKAGAMSPALMGGGKFSRSAPYAVERVERPVPEVLKYTAPDAPPIMDLSAANYEFEWPALLNDLAANSEALPTIVPPGNWKHTGYGGMGSNWLSRLDNLAVAEQTFRADEFEVVCRAWNLLVASSWVMRTPGLSPASHTNRLEFCLRYFQMYYTLAMAG